MKAGSDRQLELEVRALLGDEQYLGHPLRDALNALLQLTEQQVAQLEQVTTLSDGYHATLSYQNFTLGERYQRQLRQLRKIVRISDQYHHMLRDLNQALEVASTHDPLTGLPNRRLMLERLDGEAARAQRQQATFSVLMLDLDHFKSINDTHGHDVGDAVLKATSECLGTQGRRYDCYGRWGGEEFLGLLPGTPAEGASVVAQRLRVQIAGLTVPPLPAGRLSVSIGVAEHRPEDTVTVTLKRADEALYEAKRAGRDAVVMAP